MSLDHGELNVPLAKRHGRGGLDAEIVRQVAAQKREAAAEAEARREVHRAIEATRARFAADDLAGAVAVRTELGWHKVVRVSAKSVTVETPYSWTDRIPVGDVLEFR